VRNGVPIVQSCYVHHCEVVRQCPVLQFQSTQTNPPPHTHRQTDRQTDTLITILRARIRGQQLSRLRSEPTNYSQQNIFEALKMQDQKMQVLKMKDQISRLESAFSGISSLLVCHFQVRRFQSTHFFTSDQIKRNRTLMQVDRP